MFQRNYSKIIFHLRILVTVILTAGLFLSIDASAAQTSKKAYTVKKSNTTKVTNSNNKSVKSSRKSKKYSARHRGRVRNFINPERESKMALTNTGSYFLYDPANNEILMEKNPDTRFPPSSMTKIMTAYVVFDQINKGKIDFDNQCLIGKNVLQKSRVRPGSSLMHLHYGDVVTIDKLLRGLLVVSGNDAAIALAEATSGSVENFVDLMNKKAEELGLQNTHFMNPHGLAEDNHYMSVRDLATLTMRIRKDFPQYAQYFSISEFTYNRRHHNNTNPLIKQRYAGVTGMKTGHTVEGQYGMVGTATRDNHELIAVVNRAKTSRQRMIAVKKLLNYGFEQCKKEEDGAS